jgi:hypothetical protein
MACSTGQVDDGEAAHTFLCSFTGKRHDPSDRLLLSSGKGSAVLSFLAGPASASLFRGRFPCLLRSVLSMASDVLSGAGAKCSLFKKLIS